MSLRLFLICDNKPELFECPLREEWKRTQHKMINI